MKHSFRTVAAAAAAVLLLTVSVFAVWSLLRASDVAETFENHALSAAFESAGAIEINQSVTSGGYIFTLLGIVSGEDLSENVSFNEGIALKDRTYAALAIRRADGEPMTGEESFFSTPLIKGLKPWQFNAASMNGGYSQTVIDGVLYRIDECDTVAVFADRGLYFGITTDMFIDNRTFVYNEETGEVTVNPAFDGASALFDLPIDLSLADAEKAEDYIKKITGDTVTSDAGEKRAERPVTDTNQEWADAEIVAATVRELTLKEDGTYSFSYSTEEYGSGTFTVPPLAFTSAPQSIIVSVMESEDAEGNVTRYAVRADKAADGTVTGMIIVQK